MLRTSRNSLALTALLLAACTPAATPTAPTAQPTVEPTAVSTVPSEPTAEPVVLTDSLGREVTLAGPAKRIVSLAASNTEILFAVGAGGQVVGRDEWSDYPAEALDVPSIGSLYPNVNAETIVALEPDLVLAAGITSPDDVNMLAGLGLSVYATSYAQSLEDIYADILAVGILTGHASEAEALVESMKARVDAVTEATYGVVERPSVFFETDDSDPSKPWTRGSGSYTDLLIGLAGGRNIGALSADSDYQMGLESIVSEDPDIIIYSHGVFSGRTVEDVLARPGWSGVAAIQSGRVYSIDGNLIDRPGPRVIDGLEALAKLIHPELFQ